MPVSVRNSLVNKSGKIGFQSFNFFLCVWGGGAGKGDNKQMQKMRAKHVISDSNKFCEIYEVVNWWVR